MKRLSLKSKKQQRLDQSSVAQNNVLPGSYHAAAGAEQWMCSVVLLIIFLYRFISAVIIKTTQQSNEIL